MFKDFYLNVKLVHENAKLPTRAHNSDAGLDAYTPVNVSIKPWSDKAISLGWKCEFPEGYALIAMEKSGIATKKKLDLGACVIDSSYRGEVHVHLINNSDEWVAFDAGEKVVQFIVFPVWNGVPTEVEELSDTNRGEGGFGSSGNK